VRHGSADEHPDLSRKMTPSRVRGFQRGEQEHQCEHDMRRQADDSVGESATRSTRRSMSGQPPGVPHQESRWRAAVAILAVVGVQVTLPESLTFGPHLLPPSVELVLLAVVLAANPNRLTTESRDMRLISIVPIGVIGAANAVSLGLLVDSLLKGAATSGRLLVLAALGIWLNALRSRDGSLDSIMSGDRSHPNRDLSRHVQQLRP